MIMLCAIIIMVIANSNNHFISVRLVYTPGQYQGLKVTNVININDIVVR